jgi:hypothetical protein
MRISSLQCVSNARKHSFLINQLVDFKTFRLTRAILAVISDDQKDWRDDGENQADNQE